MRLGFGCVAFGFAVQLGTMGCDDDNGSHHRDAGGAAGEATHGEQAGAGSGLGGSSSTRDHAGAGDAGSGTAGSGTAGSGTAGSGTAGSGTAGSGTAGAAGGDTSGTGTGGATSGVAGGSAGTEVAGAAGDEAAGTETGGHSPDSSGGAAGSGTTEAGSGAGGAPGAAGTPGSAGSAPCDPDPCQHGGTCTAETNGYVCECPEDFTGKDCEYERSSCLELDTTYITDTTLAAGCYIATDDVEVTGGRLTIEPGARLLFDEGVGMVVSFAGSLSAVGTDEEPIVLTGGQRTPGFWPGLTIRSTAEACELAHVTLEYGGGGDSNGDLYLAGDFSLDPAGVSIDDCVLQHSAGFGLVADDSRDVISSFRDNTLTRNASGAALMNADLIGYLSATSSYTGNDQDTVSVLGDLVEREQTWPGIGVPYLIQESLEVGGKLTIAAGAELRFEQDTGMEVTQQGSLSAVGTEDEPITMTGAEASPGFWAGLEFYGSTEPNKLAYVTIEYAGGRESDANLTLDGYNVLNPIEVAVDHCTLRHSEGFGLVADAHSDVISSFAANTLTENALGPARVDADLVGYLSATSTCSGNETDSVLVVGGLVEREQTWPGLDVPYLIQDSLEVDEALTIAAGAELQFEWNTSLVMASGGSLSAEGTEEDPILLTGAETTPGFWRGVSFDYPSDVPNTLTHVTIEYGGGEYSDANLTLDAYAVRTLSLTATDCVFRHSAGCGVSYNGSITSLNDDFETANTFTENAEGDMCPL